MLAQKILIATHYYFVYSPYFDFNFYYGKIGKNLITLKLKCQK